MPASVAQSRHALVGDTVSPWWKSTGTVKKKKQAEKTSVDQICRSVLWRCLFCAICKTIENTWNMPSLDQSLWASPQPVQCQQKKKKNLFIAQIVGISHTKVWASQMMWCDMPGCFLSVVAVNGVWVWGSQLCFCFEDGITNVHVSTVSVKSSVI